MFHYGLTYRETLKLPLVTFWSLNRQVDRLRAEGEQRQLRVIASAASPEATKSLTEDLRTEIGNPTVIEKQFDTSKFEELSKRFGQACIAADTHTSE